MTLRIRRFTGMFCAGALALLAPLGAQESAPAAASLPAPPATGRPLLKIIVTESLEAAQSFVPPAESPFVVLSPGLASFNLVELNNRMSDGANRVIDGRLLTAMEQVIETFFRQQGHPKVDAVVPSQNIADGVVRVIVFLGPDAAAVAAQAQTTAWKIRNIHMPDTRWFSESLLRRHLRIEQGGTFRFSELDQALNWTNNNPFRRVRVKLDPIPNSPDEADLTIAVQEVMPLRLSLNYDNAGNEILGQNRFIASASYANLWGYDHQVSYQYITTDLPKVYQGHGFDYRAPLPWRHYLQFSASYLRARPEIYGGLILQDGETITSDLRYLLPVRGGTNPIDAYATLTFKQTNNNLFWDPQFSNIQVDATKTDLFQFTLGGSGVFRDRLGAWGLGASVTYSPGGINSRNGRAAFEEMRWGAQPEYVFASLSFQRLFNLKHGWDVMSRGVVQMADGNLLPSEQLSIGGGSSVRGYPENLYAGDQAFVFTTEILAPALKLQVPRLSKTRGPLETRFLAFYDAANSESKFFSPADPLRKPLASTGVGMRMSLATNFALSADYGWQLTHLPYDLPERSRGHVRVTLTY